MTFVCQLLALLWCMMAHQKFHYTCPMFERHYTLCSKCDDRPGGRW